MHFFAIILVILIAGCSDDGESTSGNEQLTVEFVEKALHEDSFTTNGTALIHEDGLQGATYDFDRVIISRVSSPNTGESLAYAYSLKHPDIKNENLFVAFYIDIDNDASTGQPIEGIGADRLLLDHVIFDALSWYGEYFIWSDTQFSWNDQPTSGSSSGSYYFNGTITFAIDVPAYVNIDNLFGLTDANGVLAVRKLTDGDPNDPSAVTLDATSIFSFSTPL
jgi:hypothetical protein